MTDLLILPRTEPVDATVTVPGSKSLTNRALLAAALAPGRSTLVGALDAEDTRIMAEALGQIGIDADQTDFSRRISLDGGAPAPRREPARLYVGNSGITARFLTAALSFIPGTWELFGKERI